MSSYSETTNESVFQFSVGLLIKLNITFFEWFGIVFGKFHHTIHNLFIAKYDCTPSKHFKFLILALFSELKLQIEYKKSNLQFDTIENQFLQFWKLDRSPSLISSIFQNCQAFNVMQIRLFLGLMAQESTIHDSYFQLLRTIVFALNCLYNVKLFVSLE